MAVALRRSDGRRRWWWKVKQVTKANFAAELDEVKARIQGCNFVAVSTQRTGDYSAPWRRWKRRRSPTTSLRMRRSGMSCCRLPFARLLAHPSTLEQKKEDESNLYQTINYDAPVESKHTTISLGTKVLIHDV